MVSGRSRGLRVIGIERGVLLLVVDGYDVPEAEKNDLLAVLGPMQTDIVGK